MIDLCVGPHIPDTGRIKALMITKVLERTSAIVMLDAMILTLAVYLRGLFSRT
jgi:threonyl-tRNA synthetase